MSNTVFLNPVEDSQKTVYVQTKNTSDKSQFKIEHKIKTALESKGYRVVTSLNKAHYLLQANILLTSALFAPDQSKIFYKSIG
jgi:hypothetical protein